MFSVALDSILLKEVFSKKDDDVEDASETLTGSDLGKESN